MNRHRPLLTVSSLTLFALSSQALAQIAAPTGLAASDGTLTEGIALSWDAVDEASGYRVLRRFGSAPPMQIGTADEPAFLDASALRGRIYEYFVLAVAEGEISPPSEGDTGWRNVPPPADLVASDGTSAAAVIVTWSQVQGNQGYRVHRGLDAESLVEIGVSNGPNFHDTAAVPGIVYTYMVTARLEPGDSAPSELETGFRAGDPPSNVPTGVEAGDGTSTEGIGVSWNPVASAEGYRVLRGVPDGSASEIAYVPQPSYFDDHAVAGVLYAYTVKAVIDGTDTEASDADTGWMNVPAPSNLVASDGTDPDGVLLSWDPVEQAIDYRVFRRRGNGNPNAPADEIATVVEPTFLDTGTLPGRPKTYFVRARTEPGDSAPSLEDAGFRGMPAPSEVRASDGSFTNRVMVRWRPVPRSGGYRVLRTGPDGIEQEIATTSGPVLQDSNVMPGVVYAYRVATIAGGEDAPLSESDTGWMNIPAPTGLAASDGTSIDAVLLSWNEVDGAVGYRLLRSTAGEPATQIATVPGPPYADLSAVQGVPYTYVVTARTPAGDSRASEPDAGFRNVRAPSGVSASDGTFPDRVEIVWNAANEPVVEGYVVLRTLEGETDATAIGEVAADEQTRFDDFTIPVDVIGSYAVRARTPAGLSASSVADTGFRQAAPLHGSDAMTSGGLGGGFGSIVTTRGDRGLPVAFKPSPGIDRPTVAAPEAGKADAAAPADRSARVDSDAPADIVAPDSGEAIAVCPRLLARTEAIERRLAKTLEDDLERRSMRTHVEFLAAISLDPTGGCGFAAGDLDLNGIVDELDLALLIEAWWIGDLRFGDLDGDGRVDESDFADWCGVPTTDSNR